MSTNVYNIIWADDECATLEKDRAIRALFDEKHIEVLRYVQTSESLRDAIECFKDKIDAVVVDGNFPRTEVPYVENDDISGLIHVASLIELFNMKRDIPFFLYTSKKVLLQGMCKNGEIDYFLQNERLVQKGELDVLADKIISSVEHIKSEEYLVRKHYQKFLDMAKTVSDACSEELCSYLIEEAKDTKFDKSIDLFTNLRKILEQIQKNCKENDIIPSNCEMTLNDFGKYFIKRWSKEEKKLNSDGYSKDNLQYRPIIDLMPMTISKSLSTLIELVQDGSHRKESLNIHVSDYIHETNNPFVFRYCLYQVMDVIRWYNETLLRLKDGSLKGRLYSIEQLPIKKKEES